MWTRAQNVAVRITYLWNHDMYFKADVSIGFVLANFLSISQLAIPSLFLTSPRLQDFIVWRVW